MKNVYKILVRKPGGKRPLGRSRNRLDDNMKIDFKEIVCEDVDLINMHQDRVQ
jgi:hypothetical protein